MKDEVVKCKIEKLIEDIYDMDHLSDEDKFILKMLIFKRFGYG